MSITDPCLIDGLEIYENDTLKLIIHDDEYWQWLDENIRESHLLNKINHYLEYIENKRYKSIYKESIFNYFIIEIRFNQYVSISDLEFLKPINRDLRSTNIKIKIVEEKSSSNC